MAKAGRKTEVKSGGSEKRFLPEVILPVIALLTVISMRTPLWDKMLGLDAAENAIASFEKSYGSEASHQVRPKDPAWSGLLKLVRGYSSAKFPENKEPKVFARFGAVASAMKQIWPDEIAQWTAPTTPVFLLYRELP